MRPISLASARGYSAALGCAIGDISPRWAAELGQSELPSGIPRLTPPPDPLLAELLTYARRMSPIGLARLVERAASLAEHYPAQTKRAGSSG